MRWINSFLGKGTNQMDAQETMPPAIWNEKLIKAVLEVASKDIQEYLLLNRNPNFRYQPSDIYSGLFETLSFEKFIEDEDIGLTAQSKAKAYQLINAMRAYASREEGLPDSEIMIDDPEWEKVRRLAREFLDELN